MKTNWPAPFNPENLPPPAPGYRYLGLGETLLRTDEINLSSNGWCVTSCCGRVVGLNDGCRSTLNTYRRALCVNDVMAPPPAEWVHEGWRVLTPDDLKHDSKDPATDQMWLKRSNSRWIVTDGSARFVKSIYYRRRVDAQCQLNPAGIGTEPPTHKPMTQPPKTIIVSVPNAILSRAVQSIAFEAGYGWGVGQTTIQHADETVLILKGNHITYDSSGRVQSARGRYPDALVLDSRTDLGQLIDLLAIKAAPLAPEIHGYKGAYNKGDNTIAFGCAVLSVSMLQSTQRLLSPGIWGGNRNIASITLSSGKTLTFDQIKVILKYVDEVSRLTT